jgi:hypothetical protein
MTGTQAKGPRTPMRVGLIEIPDSSIHVLNRYLRSPGWEVTVVVCHNQRSRVARVAQRWKLRVQPLPRRTTLETCDRVIVGDAIPNLLGAVRSLVGGSGVEVLSLEMATRGLVERPDHLLVTQMAQTREVVRPFAANQSLAHPKLFDARVLLGLSESEGREGIEIDSRDPRIRELLDRTVHDTGAVSGSILLMDADGAHLRFACTSGMGGGGVPSTHLRPGEGVAGRAFALGSPVFLQRPLPVSAEFPDDELYRSACSVPLMLGTRPLGVLSVNLETAREIAPDEILDTMAQRANELARLLLLAVRTELGVDGAGIDLLRHLVGRLINLDESILLRIEAVAEALARSVHAGHFQLYLADRPANRFQRVISESEYGARLEGDVPVDRSVLGWVLDHGRPQILEIADQVTGDRTAVVYLPIRSLRLPILIVLENVRCNDDGMRQRLEDLADITRIIEDMMTVEEGVSDRDFVSEIEMRIADETESLEGLTRDKRIEKVLNLAMELLAADVAVWVPDREADPVAAPSDGDVTDLTNTIAMSHAKNLAAWVREYGPARGTPDGGSSTDGAPPCPLRYVGTQTADGSGVLLVFFSPYEDLGTFNQIRPHALFQVVDRLCERMAGEPPSERVVRETIGERGVTETPNEPPASDASWEPQVIEQPSEPAVSEGSWEPLAIERPSELSASDASWERLVIERPTELSAGDASCEPLIIERAGEPLVGEPRCEHPVAELQDPDPSEVEAPEVDLDTDILVITSGGKHVGVPWDCVERVGSVNKSGTSKGEAIGGTAARISLATCVEAGAIPENHFIVLTEGGIRVSVACEHISGVVRLTSAGIDGAPPPRIMRAGDFMRSGVMPAAPPGPDSTLGS